MFNSHSKASEERRLKSKVNLYRLRTNKGLLSYCLNRLALNNPLQWFVSVVTFILLTLYLLVGFYDISGVWYNVKKNTDLIRNEKNLVEIDSLSVNDSGVTVIKSKSGNTVTLEKVGYVFIDGDVFGKDHKYFIAKDNIVVSPIGSDFLRNYLLGTKFEFVMLYLLFFEGIRRALVINKSAVMSNIWFKMYSILLLILYCLFLLVLFMLFT